MLAMARILRTGARLLLLDEITEGLAPVIVKKLGEVIRLLKSRGYTIVLVEQNFRFAAPLADRHYVLEHGRVVATVQKDELAQDRDAARAARRLSPYTPPAKPSDLPNSPIDPLESTTHATRRLYPLRWKLPFF
jgi:ABC-type polar amino acid transport system ATPase subunit